MECSRLVNVKHAHKRYRCIWCWEFIEIGETYVRWFYYEERAQCRMQPECKHAADKAVPYDEFLPIPGTYRRGCWCGEDDGQCTCKAKRD